MTGVGVEPISSSGDPPAPDTEDLSAPLVAGLERLREEWTLRLDTELTSRMRAVFGAARDAHRAAVDEAGLTAADEGDPVSVHALRRYRRAVHEGVVLPVLQFTNESDPGRRVGRLADALHDAMVELADETPPTVTRAAPPDQYASVDDDGVVRSALKGLFRTAHAIGGLVRRSPRQQAVPLREIAAATLHREGVAAEVAVSEGLLQFYARPLQRTAMALGVWMRDWMPAETTSHRPEAHLEPEDRERLAALATRLRTAAVHGIEGGDGDEDVESAAASDDEADSGVDAGRGHAAPPTPGASASGPLPGAVAARLQQVLDEVAESSSPEPVLSDVRSRFDRIGRQLRQRVREGGTPFARTGLPGSRRLARYRRRRDERREQWQRWYDAIIDRVRVTDEFLSLRIDTGDILRSLLGTTLHDSVFFVAERIEASREGLLGLRDRAPQAVDELGDDGGGMAGTPASDSWSIEDEARSLLEDRLLEPLRERRPGARVEEVTVESVEALGRRLGYVPQTLSVHPIREPDAVVDPVQPVRRLPVREIARQGLDVLHLEGLRTTPGPLVDYLNRVEGECRQVVEMVAYSLASAREALRTDGAGDAPPEPHDPDAPPPEEPDEALESMAEGQRGIEAAQTLSFEGLERAADSLEVILAPAVTAWHEFASGAHETLEEGREQMHARLVVEGTVNEQLRDVRSLVRSWWRGRVEWVGALRRRYAPPVRRRFLRMRIRALRLLRRGRSAMGGTDARKMERASDVLGRIPTLLEPLPLIYRRLFTFQPLTDGGLMVGREADRAWLVSQYERWSSGWCPPVVLTGSMTVGHTSFLNVMAQELGAGDGAGAPVRVVPPTRHLDETALATRLAHGFWGDEAEGLLTEAGDEADVMTGSEAATGRGGRPVWTLSRLEHVLGARGEEQVVFLERLEHLMIRIPGGCGLAERFLAFQSRTAERIFWVNSISDPAWKLLSTSEPHASGLVQIRRMEPPDRSTLEELLLTRHRRSGVPLEFVELEDPNPLLRRKLRRARSETERQDVLRTEYFDGLFRASRASVLMAILLWLRSADFTSRPGWLRMKPAQAIHFAFLEEMDLAASFALKALLEHESLTLEEYSRIFAVSREESFQTLEMLRSRLLIDRLDTPGSLPVPVRRLEEGVRYRIPPIITQVVAQNLRDQNILH